MVRLINRNNIKHLNTVLYKILKIQEIFTYIRNVNLPEHRPCIYVMWHANQFLVHGLPDREKINILISTSLDGDIVANICERWGFKVRRGSAGKKGAVASTLKMLDALKKGENAAIMVDGPHGPYHEVKRGAITLSRESGVPIVPVHWYSSDITFRTLPSWDKMTCPIGPCRIMNLYSEPIYVDKMSDEEAVNAIKEALLKLESEAADKYKEARKQKLWG